MQFFHLKEKLKDFAILSLSDLRKVEPRLTHSRLNAWQKKGYLIKLRRGFYMFSDTAVNTRTMFLVAAKIYRPAYVSLESALSWHSLIPEGVFSVTLVSTNKTANFTTPIGSFFYKHIKPSLFFGYHLEPILGQNYLVADIEKTVLDYLYFHPDIIEPGAFQEWRFNSSDFLQKANLDKMRRYATAYGSQIFLNRLESLLKLIQISA